MKAIRRIAAIICLICMVFNIVGCGKANADIVSSSPSKKEVINTSVLDTDSDFGIILKKHTLDSAGAVSFTSAVPVGENILMAGSDESGGNVFCLYNADDGSIERLNIDPGENKYFSLCQSDTETITIVLLDSNGDYILQIFDKTGASKDIALKLPDDDSSGIIEHISLVNDHIVLAMDRYFYLFDMNGELEKQMCEYIYVPMCVLNGDGSFVICRGVSSSLHSEQISTIFTVYNEDFEEEISFKAETKFTAYCKSKDSDAILAKGENNIYRVDLKTGKQTALIDWLSSGIYSSTLINLGNDQLFSLEKGTACSWSESSDSNETVELTLATYELNYELQRVIEDFNERESGVKIVVNDYANYDSESDSDIGLTRLNTDILSGNAPDIYDLTMLPAEKYAKAGALLNILPILQTSDDCSVDSLVAPAVDALKTGDSLYYITSQFSILSLISNAELTGELSSWTLDDFFNIAAQEPAEKIWGKNITQEMFIAYMLLFNGDKYFDKQTLECSFESSGFQRVLEYSALLPENSSGGNALAAASMGEQFALIDWVGVNAVNEISYISSALGNAPQYIGFPSDNGSGFAVSPAFLIGISSTTQNMDGCKTFLEFLLGPDCQNASYTMQFPIQKEALDKKIEKGLSDYEEYGAAVLTFYDGNEYIIKGTESKEDIITQIYALIDKADICAIMDDDLLQIVLSECRKYLNGDMTAEQAVKNIDSRASIYLMEQYS